MAKPISTHNNCHLLCQANILTDFGEKMIDFNKIIKASTTPKATDPIVIYSALDRISVAGPLRPVQSDILSKWYEKYRSKKDLILKLHTGAGKTLIGLLMAMSYLNGKEGRSYMSALTFIL